MPPGPEPSLAPSQMPREEEPAPCARDIIPFMLSIKMESLLPRGRIQPNSHSNSHTQG